MIKTITNLNLKLRRRADERTNTSSWDVLSGDGKFILGVIYKRDCNYLTRKYGWQEFKEHYWILECFKTHDIWIGRRQIDVLTNLYRILTPNEFHRSSILPRTLL